MYSICVIWQWIVWMVRRAALVQAQLRMQAQEERGTVLTSHAGDNLSPAL